MPAVKAIDWPSLVTDFSPVMDRVHSIFRQSAADVAAIEGELMRTMVKAYEFHLQVEIRSLGCNRAVNLTNATVIESLRQEARQMAAGMVDTYNRDLAYAIRSIRSEVPTANQRTYAKRLRDWSEARDKWKRAQVGMSAMNGSGGMAQTEFVRRNRLIAKLFVRGPRPAKCPICQGIIDGEPYDPGNAPPFPAHPNCTHDYVVKYVTGLGEVNCQDLWTGE